MQKKVKEKKCKAPTHSGGRCGASFVPRSSTQQVCSPDCARLKAIADRKRKEEKAAREERKATRTALEAIKPMSYYAGKAQDAFNEFIRLRDYHQPCISCGTTNPNVQYAAGHYRTRKAAPELRYDEMNVHKQCNAHCNKHLSGNIGEYRIGLIRRYGIGVVEYLEGPHEPKRYRKEDYQQIEQYYKGEVKKLKSRLGLI